MKEQMYSSAAANAFGPGSDLIGMQCKGKKIVSATRHNMTLETGEIIPRKGNRVSFRIETKSEWDARVKKASEAGYSIKEERLGGMGPDGYSCFIMLNGQRVPGYGAFDHTVSAMKEIEKLISL